MHVIKDKEEELPLATQITWGDPEEMVTRLSLQEQIQEDTQEFSVPPSDKVKNFYSESLGSP